MMQRAACITLRVPLRRICLAAPSCAARLTRSDHGGRHIHVYKDDREIGVYDRVDGPLRGLDEHWGKDLREAVDEFIGELDERGF
jgi:hypothetical protein